MFIYKEIRYEKCYMMKKESLSIIVSHIKIVVNQTDVYNILYKIYRNEALCF